MSETARSADKLVNLILYTPGVLDQVKTDPEPTLRRLAEQSKDRLLPIEDSYGIYRIVVTALGIVCVGALVGALVLTVYAPNSNVPDIVTALGSAAIGALAGLLAPSPTR